MNGRRIATLTMWVVLGVTAGVGLHRVLPDEGREIRARLLDELQPVSLSNCTLERLGEPHDGGYLVCGNLLGEVRSGYSYGINGYDGWGCAVSKRLDIPVHQYDCFNTDVPACPGGKTSFHPECIGPTGTQDGRRFDTLANQIAANRDTGKSIILKIDVEGAEWEVFETASVEVLDRIDQLVVEFHGVQSDRYVKTVQRLKQQFHVAHLHFNNFGCEPRATPFPSLAYEVLFVNKRIAHVDPSAVVRLPNPLDSINNPALPDCQTAVTD